MKLSIIIVNYNVKYFLEQCLLSCLAATKNISAEIWVVDNQSVDGSVEMIKDKFPEIKLIANNFNGGFSKANNQAIKQAKGEYILLLNPDTLVEESTFEKTVAFMDAHPDAGALGVRMIDGKGKFLPESKRGLPSPSVAFFKLFGLAKLFPKSRLFGRYHLKYLSEFETNEVEILSGAFMLMRKTALDKSGLLDETFFMYGEDIDLSYRIIKAGYKNYYFPETTIIHYKGESTKKSSVNYVFVFYKAMVIFAEKHYGNNKAKFFSLVINIAIWFRAFAALCWRFFDAIKFAVADFVLLFSSHWYIKYYWENNHKYVEGGSYPMAYYTNIFLYTFIVILSMLLAGAYQKRIDLKKVWNGIMIGFIANVILYAFLPESMRFSRALLLLGSAFGGIAILLFRLLSQWVITGKISFENSQNIRTLIVGNYEEAERVNKILLQANSHHEVAGYCSYTAANNSSFSYLGTPNHIKEICEVFRIEEIIFCSENIRTEDIIKTMGSKELHQVSFKIIPEKSVYIIGSNSKNSQGDLYTIDLKLNIAKKRQRVLKRILDIKLSVLVILFFPFLFIFKKNRKEIWQNACSILAGNKTWIGYAPSSQNSVLPVLKPGFYNTLSVYSQEAQKELEADQVNFFYAKDYSVFNDLKIFLKNIFK